MDIPLWFSCIFVMILTVMVGISSAAEAAFIAASKASLHHMAKRGNKKATLVEKLRASMDKLLSSILLFNILINTMSTAFATTVMVELFGDKGVFYATGIMTALTVTYGEVMPKVYAIAFAEKTSTALAPILSVLVKLLTPLTHLMQKAARITLRLMGVHIDAGSKSSSSLEELRGAIDLHHGSSEEASEERAMLHSILDLGDVEVSEIMIHRKNTFMIDASLPLEEILHAVISSPFTRIPFWRENSDNVIGVLHVKALFRAWREAQGDMSTVDPIALLSAPWFIPESTTLQEQLQAFRNRKEHFALVVDEYGSLQGVVTLEDIIEEIVGDISDEHDLPLDGVWQRKDGTIVSVGTTTLRDLNRKFDWSLPDEEASTIAGLMLHEARMIPDIGQTFLIHGFKMKVLRRIRNQLTLISLQPLHKQQDPHDAV